MILQVQKGSSDWPTFSRYTNNVEHSLSWKRFFPQELNTGIWQLNFGVSAESYSSKTRRSTELPNYCFSLIVHPSCIQEAPSEAHRYYDSKPKPLLPLWLQILTNTLTHIDPSMLVSTIQDYGACTWGLQFCLASKNWNIKCFSKFIQFHARLCSVSDIFV